MSIQSTLALAVSEANRLLDAVVPVEKLVKKFGKQWPDSTVLHVSAGDPDHGEYTGTSITLGELRRCTTDRKGDQK